MREKDDMLQIDFGAPRCSIWVQQMSGTGRTSQHWLALVGTGRWGSQGEWALEETVGDQVETGGRPRGDRGETGGPTLPTIFAYCATCSWEALTMLNL